MQLISGYSKGIRFLLCVIDIFSKYAWVVPLKDKKGVRIAAAFQSILKQSNRKPNKIFIEEKEGSKYLNISLTYSNNAEVWSGIKDQIKKINNGSVGEYAKDYMKIKFDSDDNLPLNKILKFRVLIIIIRNIFEKDGKYFPQTFLDDCLYEI